MLTLSSLELFALSCMLSTTVVGKLGKLSKVGTQCHTHTIYFDSMTQVAYMQVVYRHDCLTKVDLPKRYTLYSW